MAVFLYALYTDIVSERDEPNGGPDYPVSRERIKRRSDITLAWLQRNGIHPSVNTESTIARAMPLFAEYTRRNPTLCFLFANPSGETRTMYRGELAHYRNHREAMDAISAIADKEPFNPHGPPPAAQ